MNRADLQRLSRLRIQEARSLFKLKHYSGAYYLAGYSVECALKACLARDTPRFDFPDKELVLKSYTHKPA
jgi:HEPN domain-containing protein